METRWIQRLDNYRSALQQLISAAEIAAARPLTDLEKQGVIQAFEFTHELAWNVMKDFLSHQGSGHLIGSRDATREAFKNGLIPEGETWMEMIQSRNLTTHTYNKKIADSIVAKILQEYIPVFQSFAMKMESLKP